MRVTQGYSYCNESKRRLIVRESESCKGNFWCNGSKRRLIVRKRVRVANAASCGLLGQKRVGERICINGLRETGGTMGLCGLSSGGRVPVTCWLWKIEIACMEREERDDVCTCIMWERERRYKIIWYILFPRDTGVRSIHRI